MRGVGRRWAHDRRDDRGSVMLLGLGAITICLLAVVVAVDASAAFLQRRALVAVADAGALAGAQALDVETYYREGASGATSLSPGEVEQRVRDFLQRTNATQLPGLSLEAVTSDGRFVTVAVSAPLTLPFLSAFADEPLRAESRARLAYRPVG